MYDTLCIKVDRYGADDFAGIPALLTNRKEWINKETGSVNIRGNLRNFRISISLGGISIQGSLAKFYFGDNLHTLDVRTAKEAIGELSHELGISFDEAHITRLDFGANLFLKYSPAGYFTLLSNHQQLQRREYEGESIYYNRRAKNWNNLLELSFYDKSVEYRKKTGPLPTGYAGKNILRYEVKWRGRDLKKIQNGRIMVAQLHDPAFFLRLVDAWAEHYYSIPKHKIIQSDCMGNIKTVSDAFNALCAMAFANAPEVHIEPFLDILKERQIFPRAGDYSRLKQKVAKVVTNPQYTACHDLVRELDEAIADIQKTLHDVLS